MNELSALRAEYKTLTGKNPSPALKADTLAAKIADVRAAKAAEAAPPAQEPPAQEPPAQEPPAQEPPAQEPPAQEPPAQEPPAQEPPAQEPPAQEPPAPAEQVGDPSLEEQLAELGLTADAEGLVGIEMLTSMSGPEINLVNGDPHRCDAAEAVRLVRAAFARPR